MQSIVRVLFVLAFVATASPQTAPLAVFSEIRVDIEELSRLTGLTPLKSVRHEVISREQLKRFLEERIRDEFKPEEIRVEELALKKLGLAPAEFDLARTTVDLMTEQAEALYDYRQKRLFLLETTGLSQDAALFHELAHALADQHFRLEKYLKRGKTDDAALARMAVMEGQATWLMYEWMAAKAGMSLLKSPALADRLGSHGDASDQYPVLKAAPLYVRASLLFPYIHGLKFQQAVVARMGKEGFREVFRNPPASTQQVLHPEYYFARTAPAVPKLPELAKSGHYRDLTEGTLGEFDHAVLLEQYAGKTAAQELAPAWAGGAYRIVENRDGRRVLLYASEWKDAAAARRFFEAYQAVLRGKWKSFSHVQQQEGVVSGSGDDGVFRLCLEGARVTSVEGLKSPAELRQD